MFDYTKGSQSLEVQGAILGLYAAISASFTSSVNTSNRKTLNNVSITRTIGVITMPNFTLNVAAISSNGMKCDGAQYTSLFRSCYEHVAKNGKDLKDSASAVAMFWKKWDDVSAPYHTGDAGKRKYSAPFLSAIAAAFTKSAEKATEKAS